MTPLAPARFSTTTGWPRRSLKLWRDQPRDHVDGRAGRQRHDHAQRPVRPSWLRAVRGRRGADALPAECKTPPSATVSTIRSSLAGPRVRSHVRSALSRRSTMDDTAGPSCSNYRLASGRRLTNAVSGFSPVPRRAAPARRVDRYRPAVALTDVGKALKQAYRRQGRPALMFNNNGTEFPLVCGVYANRAKALLAFQADEKTILHKVLTGLDNPITPAMVKGHGARATRSSSPATTSTSGAFRSRPTARRTAAPTSRPASWCRRIRRPACRTSAIIAS